jgi:hypothetical protein
MIVAMRAKEQSKKAARSMVDQRDEPTQ